MKRKSSRGNPYHVPAGSPKGGQFTTKNGGVAVLRNEGYYEARTKLRKGEISEEDFRQTVKASNSPSETPKYDSFTAALKQSPDVSSPDAKRELFKSIAASAGVECNVPIRMTKGKHRTGSCKAMIKDDGAGPRKQIVGVTLSSEHDYESQVDTLYHEAYHFCSDGGLTTEYSVGWGKPSPNKRDAGIEETMAVCSANALCTDTGVNPPMPTYSSNLAEHLPRLKHNTEQYANCNTITDVGRIAWNERIENKNAMWDELGDEMYSKPLPKGYYKPYIDHATQNREKIIDDLVTKYGAPDNPSFRKEIVGYFTSACDSVSHGARISTLKHNEKLVFSDAIMYGFREMGIL